MVVSEIDEDFVDIVNLLNENGYRPFSSCDGVLSHHPSSSKYKRAYISFLKSDGIIDLITAISRDVSNFVIRLSSNSHISAYEYFGNVIDGNTYSVYFDNQDGEKTEYFKHIIMGVINGTILVSDDEKERLQKVSECLDTTENSELGFGVEVNGQYQPYMNKKDKTTNKVTIYTKTGIGYERDMKECASLISEKLGITLKGDGFDEKFENDEEFVVPCFDKCSLEYYCPDDDLTKIIQIIDFVKEHEKELSTFISRNPDDDPLYYDYIDVDGEQLDDDFSLI